MISGIQPKILMIVQAFHDCSRLQVLVIEFSNWSIRWWV